MKNQVTCEECSWMGDEDSILTDVNPFDPLDMIQGCPDCKSVNTLLAVCEYDYCQNIVTCGIPTDNGYKHVCGEHYSHYQKIKELK